MKRVLTAAILIPLVILALFKAPLWLFTLLVFGVAVLAAREYLGIVKAGGFQPVQTFSYFVLTVVFLIFYGMAHLLTTLAPDIGSVAIGGMVGMLLFFGVPVIAMLAPLIFLIISLRREPLLQALPDAAVSYMVIPYVGFTLALIPVLRSVTNGGVYLLLLMLLVWCGDIAAYYVGRAFGKHKLAPRISPGKTLEGAIASVLGAIAVGSLFFNYIGHVGNALRALHLLVPPGNLYAQSGATSLPGFSRAPIWLVVLFAASINVAAQVGDLVESAMKRGAGLKDSGTLLPGHGGMLDRIDALLFALPVGLIYYIAALGRHFSAMPPGNAVQVVR